MADICNDVAYSCNTGSVTIPTSGGGATVINQIKDRTYEITIAGVVIPLNNLHRKFQISYNENWSWSGNAVYDGSNPDLYFCGTKVGTSGAQIEENITYVESELLYLDHINNIVFWKETVESCQFSYAAQKTAIFRGGYGSFYSHWFELEPTKTKVVKYKLLVNGSEETVWEKTYSSTSPIINVLFPLPPSSVGPTGNPDHAPEAFYDYYMDEELRIADGGIDWYYPSWMRSMGINRTEDAADALDRYETYFMHGATLSDTEVLSMPTLPTAAPYGNAVVDGKGNILISFAAEDFSINRLYKKDSSEHTEIKATIQQNPGDKRLKIYPVGIV